MMTTAINIGRRQYLADDGEIYPIVAWFDGDGDDCEPEDAVSAVAGIEGRWWPLRISDFIGAMQ
jgi:hypothetical protein